MSAKDDLIILGIETSCDDTAAAVVRGNGEILSQVVSSQVKIAFIRLNLIFWFQILLKFVLNQLTDLLAKYGGVAPKMAEEAHSLAIDPVVQEALHKANLTERDLSAVAVTIGPGLSLCLRVGVQKARKIAGGHNLLVLAHNLGQYTQLGTTIDDAIGEAFDKTAKWLGLDMRRSGGPAVEKLALEGDAESVKFSTPMKQHKDCNFSYAGLKTQVRLAIESKNINVGKYSNITVFPVPIFVLLMTTLGAKWAFQRVAVLHLEERCERAIEWALKIEPSIKHLVVSGGVASNKYVRARLDRAVKNNSLQLVCPPPSLCTDNGVMVAWTGIEHFCVGRFDPPPPADDPEDFMYDLRPRWPLGEEFAEGRSEARSLRKARMHPSLTSIIQASMQQQSP
ncbi:putative tRNA N6-adenosine threonylcarbamoyltransferase [Citrus sinensis]|uniref:tRNA N6-adenosine threonylcarbamoyltransferase n=1 Tax=Citrus sinensis TaxID=2711 RepID=A0ACB8MR94_CITSI|nr:putative tRNA N6-adenosine threonylcarbamoyltransferase [Citrus sinensis]